MQVPMPKGRGMTPPFSCSYESGSVHNLLPMPGRPGLAQWVSNYFPQGGWGNSVPMAYDNQWTLFMQDSGGHMVSCFYTTNYVFRDAFRSEERRVGKECRSRWSPYH